MVTRVVLVVALACFAVPASLMGSATYLFISENPDFSDAVVDTSQNPVWKAAITEIESDSEVSAPDGYEQTDSAYIHSLGLLTPSEIDLLTTDVHRDWHSECSRNRKWNSQITTSYTGNNNQYKLVQVLSGTYRCYIPGPVAVRCTTWKASWGQGGPGSYVPVWYPDWAHGSWWKVELSNSWQYGNGSTFAWIQNGRHTWDSPDTLRTSVGTHW
ncbi:MAG TPA: hypothetical protein VMH22_14755 [bacterium]|nr:hypothetical protein [bacterium]